MFKISFERHYPGDAYAYGILAKQSREAMDITRSMPVQAKRGLDNESGTKSPEAGKSHRPPHLINFHDPHSLWGSPAPEPVTGATNSSGISPSPDPGTANSEGVLGTNKSRPIRFSTNEL